MTPSCEKHSLKAFEPKIWEMTKILRGCDGARRMNNDY